MGREEEESQNDLRDLVGGTLNILGLKMDLGELLNSAEDFNDRLEELRRRLKTAGGKEVLSDEAWRQGGASISGEIRTRGVLGDREFHIGTTGRPGPKQRGQAVPEPPEAMEPPVDLFEDGQDVTIIADVPGVSLEDLELKVEGKVLVLSTKNPVRRNYRKEIRFAFELDPDSLRAAGRNGVLEISLRKRSVE